MNKNSSAAHAGIKIGDVIIKVDNKTVSDVASLHTILYNHKIGDAVTLTVNRGGKEINLRAKLESN